MTGEVRDLPRRVLVTGSRNWSDRQTLTLALKDLWEEWGSPDDAVLVEGGARGADSLARDVWSSRGYPVETVRAEWNAFGKRAGHLRNQAMVDRGADVCLAFPTEGSIGTWDCVRRAEAAGIPVRVISG